MKPSPTRVALQHLRLRPDYGDPDDTPLGAAVPRGKEAKPRPHLNKEDPGSILAHLRWLLVDKHGLSDLAPDIKKLSQRVDQEWQSYRER